METLNNRGITQTAIDIFGFWAGNTVLHKSISEFPKPSSEKIIIFGISDLAIRNNYVSYWMEKVPFSGQTHKNAYIALISFAASSAVDLLKKKDIKTLLMHNLMLNAVGFGANTGVDMLMADKYR